MTTGWSCPRCGDLAAVDIAPYREGVFNAASRRFDPRCRSCEGRATFDTLRCDAGPTAPVLVLSGSCASGKTTLSYLLSEHYGFVQIDGDYVLERHRSEEQRRVDADEIHPYLLTMAEGFARLGRPVALAHIVPPHLIPHYQAWLKERHIAHRIVIIMPRMPVLLERNEIRVCWPKATPEHWVRKFHDDYLNAPEPIKALFYDNSDETPDQTATALAQSIMGDKARG
jgi:hypothetical protein